MFEKSARPKTVPICTLSDVRCRVFVGGLAPKNGGLLLGTTPQVLIPILVIRKRPPMNKIADQLISTGPDQKQVQVEIVPCIAELAPLRLLRERIQCSLISGLLPLDGSRLPRFWELRRALHMWHTFGINL